jgi:hypothetical protein
MQEINHLFWRFIYLGACWFVALRPVLTSDKVDPQNVLSTLFLFFMPLLIDYWGFLVITKFARTMRRINFYITLGCTIVIGMGTFSGVNPINVDEKKLYGLSLNTLWYLLSLWVFLALIDWITLTVYRKEARAQANVQKAMRKEQSKILKETPLKKRITYHEKDLEKNGGVDV